MTTSSITGTKIAAATNRTKASIIRTNNQSGIPQNTPLFVRISEASLSLGKCECLKFELQRLKLPPSAPPLDPGMPGGGKEARMSERLPDRRSEFRLAFSDTDSEDWPSMKKFMPSLLAVLPRSRLDASFVARAMRSLMDVREPRVSAS